MTPNDYQISALRTMAPQGDILLRLYARLGTRGMQLIDGLTGLTDEVGEIASAVKKFVEYGQPLDTVNLQEEVGDALWRLAQICDAAGLTLGGCMASNLEKLRIRFPERYSDERAAEANRDRGAERKVIDDYDGPISAGTLGGTIPVTATHEERWAAGLKVVQDGHGFGHEDYVVSPTPLQVGERCKTIREVGPLNPNRHGVGRMLPPGLAGFVMGRIGTDGFEVSTEYGHLYIDADNLIPVRETKRTGCSIACCPDLDPGHDDECPNHPSNKVKSRPAFVCTECGDSGWKLSTGDPRNGSNPKAKRCSKGCPSRCGVCGNDDCGNPNGQH